MKKNYVPNLEKYDDTDIERIAVKYSEAKDELKLISPTDVMLIRKFINYQFIWLQDKVYFDFVNAEPYHYDVVQWLIQDFKRGFIRVNATGNDSAFWEKFHNLQFRAIHDYIHTAHRLDFNFSAEVEAYQKQIEFSLQDDFTKRFPAIEWELYCKVLRSEIIYQAAVKTHFKEFHIDQKIILSDL